MKKLPIILIVIVTVLTLGYVSGALYFQNHLLPNQTLQGIQVGMMTPAEAVEAIDQNLAQQKVEIEVVETVVETTLGDLGVTIDTNLLVTQALTKQQPWLWPLAFMQVEAAQTQTYQINQETMQQALLTLGVTNPEGKTAASNAAIEKTATDFALTDEISGTLLNADSVHKMVSAALAQGKTKISVVAAREVPTIQADQLQPLVDTANKMSANPQVLTIRDQAITISAEEIFAWVNIVDNQEVVIDEAAVQSYVQSLVNEYTVMATASTLNTTTMQQSGGMEGSTLDVSATTKAIITAIESGKQQKVAATLTSISSPTQIQGVGNTYVQVSIADQHLWYYQNGQLVLESDIITGDETQGWGTITGVYSIQAKERDAVLEGYSYGWDYSVPVKYWMPIYSDGTGIHDASWHSSFGGTKYLGGGSHGCINLPPAVAEQLFNTITIGTPVVIYK